MKKLLPVLIAILFFSCKSKDQRLREQIEPVLRNIAVQDSFVYKLDSIKIYKISNLNDLELANRKYINLMNRTNLYISLTQSTEEGVRLQERKIQLGISQAKLYLSIGSPSLSQIQLDDNKRDSEDLKKQLVQVSTYSDSAKFFLNQSKAIEGKIKAHKIDSTNFKGYVILYQILGSDNKNMEIKRDSIKTYLSPAFRIIPINNVGL